MLFDAYYLTRQCKDFQNVKSYLAIEFEARVHIFMLTSVK